MRKRVYYITAVLGLVLVLGTFIDLIYNVFYGKIPASLMLIAACACLLGLVLAKSRWTLTLMFLMVGLGISAVILFLTVIHGG